MELKIYRDTVTAMGSAGEAVLEVPLESEILIPDYLPQVFKIVKTFVHRVVLQKQVQAGHLLVEGYFRVEILYQGDDQSLCAVEQKIAFSKQQELKGCEDAGDCQIDTDGDLQYINCRAVSQRRLDVRGAYNLNVHVLRDYSCELITALSENGIQQKNTLVPALRIFSSQDKQFTLEEDIHFEQTCDTVLHTQASVSVQETRIVGGKAIAKGEVRVRIVYRSTGSAELHLEEAVLPFNQVVELENAADDSECLAQIEPIGCSIFSDDADSAQTKISCTCLATLRALKKMEYAGVADCFSTLCQTEVSYHTLETETLLETLSNTIQVHTDGKLPDDSLEVLECFPECQCPELVADGSRAVVRGKAVAHLICRNALGEIDCYDKTCEYTLPKKYDGSAEEMLGRFDAGCESVSFSKKGDEASVEIGVHVQGFLCKKYSCELVDNVACGQPLESDDAVALRVYYAGEGEAVFDIAKRYHASPSDISALAGIDGDTLAADARLLIPQGR